MAEERRPGDAGESKSSKAQQLVEGLAERRERHKERSRVYRLAVVVAGVIVLLAGLAMTVLPGPAFVVIPIGLSLLALEFVWAESVLDKLAKGADFALGFWPPPRKAVVVAAVVLVAGVAAFLVLG
ncbi:MAG TPA: PGPGW domain-containing protein [Thermoleophilaceae bacterium]|nr:PGPGW domain-containing protein [Thermoleophilaceae bacterium]